MLIVVLRLVWFLGRKSKEVRVFTDYLLLLIQFITKQKHSRVLKMMMVVEQIAAASPS